MADVIARLDVESCFVVRIAVEEGFCGVEVEFQSGQLGVLVHCFLVQEDGNGCVWEEPAVRER